MEKSRRPVTPSWWTKRTMNLIRTWSPSFNSLSARIETSTATCYQLWLRILPRTSYATSKYLEQMSDHYFFLLGVLGHVFPIEVDCVCCLFVEYSRAANIKHHHFVNICCKYQRSPYCQYLLNHHHQDHISYLDYFALLLIGFLCQLMSLVSSKIPESSSSPVR